MAEESFQDRTEPATGKKREDARKKGQVAKSAELNSAFVLIFGVMILYFTGKALAVGLAGIMSEMLTNASVYRLNDATAHELLATVIVRTAALLAPVALGLMAVGLAANVAQVGFMFSLESVQPAFRKLNPLTGIKKVLISRRSMVELLKNFIKITIVGLVAYFSLDSIMTDTISLMDTDVAEIFSFMAKAALSVGIKTGLAYFVLAALDYFYQRFEYEKEMRMTKQEVKEESRQSEGDPMVKGRIRSIQRRIAYKRMMHDVPKADVVVTNPTHLAVALKYESERMTAPKVVAKGADLIALKIKELARANGVPVVEDKPLARALYKSVEIGDEVPEKLFQAVAQVLAYIYKLKSSRRLVSMN